MDSEPEIRNFNAESILPAEYKLEKRLGYGGSGSVYKAIYHAINEPVAIKFFHRETANSSADDLERLKKEARAISMLDHPNIVKVLHMGIAKDQTPFLVYEFLEGETLRELLEPSKRISVEMISFIFEQISDALQYAHSMGVVHRDIKPDNIMILSTRASLTQVKLLDFGLAKIQASENSVAAGIAASETATGKIQGSPQYMSPEQCRGSKADSRSDIYSLACILFQTLTGKLPIKGESQFELLYNHMNAEPALPNKLLSPSMNELLIKALAKTPDKRPLSVQLFNDELQKALKEQKRTRTANTPYTTVGIAFMVLFLATSLFVAWKHFSSENPKTNPDNELKNQQPRRTKTRTTTLFNDLEDVAREGLSAATSTSSTARQERQAALKLIENTLPRIKEYKGNRDTDGAEYVLYDEKGDIEYALKKLDAAENSYNRCLAICKKWSEDGIPSSQAIKCYAMLALIKYDQKKWNEMKDFIEKGSTIASALYEGRAKSVELPFLYKSMNAPYMISTLNSLNSRYACSKNSLAEALQYSLDAEIIMGIRWGTNKLGRPFLDSANILFAQGKEREGIDHIRNSIQEIEPFNLSERAILARPFDPADAYYACLEALQVLRNKHAPVKLQKEILNAMSSIHDHHKEVIEENFANDVRVPRNSLKRQKGAS